MEQNDTKVTAAEPSVFTDEQRLHGERRWSLLGAPGGISWSCYGGEAGSIAVHSRTPMAGDTESDAERCEVLGGQCFPDGGSGQALMRRWVESGGNVDVVRAELESWYEREFGGESR